MQNKMRPIHPGEIIREEYLAPSGMSAETFAVKSNIPLDTLNKILSMDSPITNDIADLLAYALGTSPEFWLRLQEAYDSKINKKV